MRYILGFLVCVIAVGDVRAQALFPDLAVVRSSGSSSQLENAASKTSVTQPTTPQQMGRQTSQRAPVVNEVPSKQSGPTPLPPKKTSKKTSLPAAGSVVAQPSARVPSRTASDSMIAIFGSDAVVDEGLINVAEESVDSAADLTQAADLDEAFDMLAAQSDESEIQTNMDKGRVLLVLDNVSNTLPPARNFSFCSGTMNLENQLPMEIKQLSVSLTFGTQKVNLSFSGVAKKGKQSQAINLNGTACEHILEVPKMEVEICQVGELSEKDCKSRIQYVPF